MALVSPNGFLLMPRDLLRGVRLLIVFQGAAWASLWAPQGLEVYAMEVRKLSNVVSLSLAGLTFALCLLVCAHVGIESSKDEISSSEFVRRIRSYLPAFISVVFLVVAAVAVARGLHSPINLHDDPTKGQIILKMGPIGGCLFVALGRSARFGSKLQIQRNALFRATLGVLVVMAILFAVLSVLTPVSVGQLLGPHAVVLLAVGAWMVVITACRIAWKGRPWVMVAVAIGFAGAMLTDSHEIRIVSAGSGHGTEPISRPIERTDAGASDPDGLSSDSHLPPVDVHAAYQQFRLRPNETSPMVIVSTAGGGLRAAYWTVTVLGELQDEHPEFGSHLFAISAVSGGALGAVVFDALLERSRSGKPISCVTPEGTRGIGFRQCGQAVLRNDFLSPVLLRLTVSDALPLPLLPDRAAALELAWEQGWSRAFPDGSPGLDDRFGLGPSRMPIVVLNGVSAVDGARLVTATVDVNDGVTNLARIVPMRLSTAANNSARFPIIEPAGSIVDPDGRFHDAVVDGGYVENFGADSTLDILRQVMFETEDDRNLDKDPRPRRIRKIKCRSAATPSSISEKT
jgi:hypothetical protein